jgi:hypothetical protein
MTADTAAAETEPTPPEPPTKTAAIPEPPAPWQAAHADQRLTAYLDVRRTDHQLLGVVDEGWIEARGPHALTTCDIDIIQRWGRVAEAKVRQLTQDLGDRRSTLARARAAADEWRRYAIEQDGWPQDPAWAAMANGLCSVLAAIDGDTWRPAGAPQPDTHAAAKVPATEARAAQGQCACGDTAIVEAVGDGGGVELLCLACARRTSGA